MKSDRIGFTAVQGINQTLVAKSNFLFLGGLSFAFSKLRNETPFSPGRKQIENVHPACWKSYQRKT